MGRAIREGSPEAAQQDEGADQSVPQGLLDRLDRLCIVRVRKH